MATNLRRASLPRLTLGSAPLLPRHGNDIAHGEGIDLLTDLVGLDAKFNTKVGNLNLPIAPFDQKTSAKDFSGAIHRQEIRLFPPDRLRGKKVCIRKKIDV
ncbi:MAG TPA: hypothetical protein VHC00_15705 [Rhizobiaceae bacterium]|nr:hypothetical protein [Rhizobiaceae bacterium]